MSAYKKLLLYNEVTCGRNATCLNDITKILDVPTPKEKSRRNIVSSVELETLKTYDFEHSTDEEVEYRPLESLEDDDQLHLHSTAYLAAVVEESAIKQLVRKGTKSCLKCINVFIENDIINDNFIAFIATKSKIIPPCKSTFDIIQYVDSAIKKYESQKVSFQSMIAHIINTMDISRFYTSSVFDEDHDHQFDLIEHLISVYLNIKSRNASKLLTRLSQTKLLRHEKLKQVHKEGQ